MIPAPIETQLAHEGTPVPPPPETDEKSARQDRVVPPSLRPDLVISKQRFEGRVYYVFKDPVSLQYFRLSHEDYDLAVQLDGRRSFGEIRARWLALHPALRLEYTEQELNERILRFVNDLGMLRFLNVHGTRLKAQYEQIRKNRKKASKGFLYNLTNQLFFFKKGLFDPDKVFGMMARPLWWIWTREAFWISVLIILAGAVVFFSKAEHLDEALAGLFNWHNLALMWVTTIVLKSIHELGHGLTCKHFGGEVHEVGFMTIVFTPMFYVNVSDAWTMPNRIHRILVSAAGIYVELVLAALAAFLWAVVQPGFLKDFLFNIIIIASISTILFNANPLMRFDGYYIMIDLIEVPNLQQKSRALITQKVTQWLFGKKDDSTAMARLPLPKRGLPLFYTYAVLSWLYGYYVIYSLIIYMRPHLVPLGIEGLTDAFAFLALTGWVVIPIMHFFKELKFLPEDFRSGGRGLRMLKVLGIPLLLLIIAGALPLPTTVERHSAVEISDPEQIRPEVPGFLPKVEFTEGTWIAPGTTLAKMENRELRLAAETAALQLRATEAAIQQARALNKPDELLQLEYILKARQAQLAEAEANIRKLELRAVKGGVLLTRDLGSRVGMLLRAGDTFCEIAPLDPIRISIPLSEKQVRTVRPGQRVELAADAFPGIRFQGTVTEEPSPLARDRFPAAFSKQRGGDVPTIPGEHGAEYLAEHTYVVTVDIANPGNRLRHGMSIRARVETGTQPLWQTWANGVLDLISLDYRLMFP